MNRVGFQDATASMISTCIRCITVSRPVIAGVGGVGLAIADGYGYARRQGGQSIPLPKSYSD